jgi:hypothetical protein
MPDQLAIIINVNCIQCGAAPHPAQLHEFRPQEVSADVLRGVLREPPEERES